MYNCVSLIGSTPSSSDSKICILNESKKVLSFSIFHQACDEKSLTLLSSKLGPSSKVQCFSTTGP